MKTHLQSFVRRIIAIVLAISPLLASVQTLSGSYSTSWVGNSLVPESSYYNFVQNWANSMFVADDGTIFTNSNWDEGAKEMGVYKNGAAIGSIDGQHEHADGGAVTANGSYIWASVHSGSLAKFKGAFGK